MAWRPWTVFTGRDGQPPLDPCVILLDINMPLMNGVEFLQELRRDSALRRSIVFVLSTSDLDRDMRAAYDHGVAGYVLKTDLSAKWASFVQMLNNYCEIVAFPPMRCLG